jgi:hypothetical protein
MPVFIENLQSGNLGLSDTASQELDNLRGIVCVPINAMAWHGCNLKNLDGMRVEGFSDREG